MEGGPGLEMLTRPQYEGAPCLVFKTWDIATMQAPGSVRGADTSMMLPLACLSSEASASTSISTGKERDAESGLDYFGARYLSSGLGRFMTPDWAAKPTAVPYAEFGDPQTLNLYAYVDDNPMGKMDQDGHCGTICGFLISTAVSIITSHSAIGAAVQKIAGSVSLKINAGVGLEESIGKNGFKGSVAASATVFGQLSTKGLTTGSDLKFGASIETPITGKQTAGGTAETISKENGVDLAEPGRTEDSNSTGIGNFSNDEKTLSFGDETGAGPDLGAEVDVNKSEFMSGTDDLGSAVGTAILDTFQPLPPPPTTPPPPPPPEQ